METSHAPIRLSANTLDALKTGVWLPTSSGPRPPIEVIHIPGLEDELARLVNAPHIQRTFVDVGMIAPDVRTHPAFDILSAWGIFPTIDEALENLALCLDAPNYHLGSIDLPASLNGFLQAFAGVDPTLLPCITFLQAIFDKIGEIQCRSLAERLCHDLPIQKICAVLTALAEKHEKDGTKEKASSRAAHTLYLRTLVNPVEPREFQPECLRGLRLLNRTGRWQRVERLCLDGLSLNGANVLDEGQADIIRDHLGAIRNTVSSNLNEKAALPGDTATLNASGVSHLREYFRSWRGCIPDPAIGGFLALLGNKPATLKETAEEWLRPRTVQGVRDQLLSSWKPNVDALLPRFGRRNVHDQLSWISSGGNGAGNDIHESMDIIFPFVFRIFDPTTQENIQVPNLLDEPFQAPISPTFDHLLVGEVNSITKEELRKNGGFPITLRTIDVSSYPSPNALIELLIETARILLDKVFHQQPANLDDWMKKLADTGQFDLDLARAKILHHAFFYFGQLNHEALQPLKALSTQWNDLYDREVEAQQSDKLGRDMLDILNARERLRNKLRDRLENDPEISQVVLKSVRKKVEDYNYAVDSIPFEIFQNSDDAVVELAEMRGIEGLPLDAEKIVIHSDATALRFLHWGRPINKFRQGTFSSEAGKGRGFHDDLIKMLILQSSDKSSEGDAVTGKFGLGFKSCFLFTDTPRVLSGSLGFEVAAGMFPASLEANDRERLQNEIERQASTRETGTVIELRGREGSYSEAVLGRFRKLAPLLLPFARRLRRLILIGEDGKQEHLAWAPHSLTSCVVVGAVTANADSIVRSGMLLVLRGRDNGALMFHVQARGLTPLPDSWKTEPLIRNEYLNMTFDRHATGPDLHKRLLGIGSKVIDQALAQAIGRSTAVASIPSDVLQNPLIIFRLRDRVTGEGLTVRSILIGVELREPEPILLYDWQVLIGLNDIPLRRAVLQYASSRPISSDDVHQKIVRAEALLQQQLDALDHQFRYPVLDTIAFLCPQSPL